MDIDSNKDDYIAYINCWRRSYIASDLRLHILFFTGHKILLNQRRRHVYGVNPNCRFCLKNNAPNPPPENYKHVLSICPSVLPLIDSYFAPLRSELGRGNSFLFIGSQKCELSEFLNIEILLFSLYIINCLKGHARPSLGGLRNMMSTHKKIMRANSTKYNFMATRADTIFGHTYSMYNS